jgi:glycosyltransferase involved in cell wall biosynthesis
VIRAAVAAIRRERPSCVVIQNYVVPALEVAVHAAARRAGAKLVFVVHDHRLHARSAGLHAGLGRLLRSADVVVAHSEFVAAAVREQRAGPVVVLPVPVPIGLERRAAHERPVVTAEAGRRLAVTFGNLFRAYKGAGHVADIAARAPAGWTFAALGPGAAPSPGVLAYDRFLGGGELWATVAASAVSLLPYRYATQSAAVVLAQACGSVPIASAIGGIAEQIEDGRTGVLLAPGAPVDEWVRVLAALDPARCVAMADDASGRARRDHARAVDGFEAMLWS